MRNYLGLIEMLFIFGCGLALVIYEIVSLGRGSSKEKSNRERDSVNDLDSK